MKQINYPRQRYNKSRAEAIDLSNWLCRDALNLIKRYNKRARNTKPCFSIFHSESSSYSDTLLCASRYRTVWMQFVWQGYLVRNSGIPLRRWWIDYQQSASADRSIWSRLYCFLSDFSNTATFSCHTPLYEARHVRHERCYVEIP